MSKYYSKLSDAVIMLLALVAHQAAAVTETPTLRRRVVQDGGSYSGVEDWTEDQALDGNAMSVQSYTVPYSSFGGVPVYGPMFCWWSQRGRRQCDLDDPLQSRPRCPRG